MSGLFLRRSVVVVLLPHPDSRVIPLPNRTSPVRLRSPYGLPPTHPNLSPMKRPRVAGLNSNRVARLSDAAIQCRIPTAIHTYTSDNVWLLFFMVGCSINFGLPVLTQNWPFRYVAMPWGGVLGCAFYIALGAAITVGLSKMVGTVFTSMNEALSFGYMGVNWSIGLLLTFGLGFNRPYLWAGQKSVGTWDANDELAKEA